MSRKIKLTEEDINELVNNFKASLTGMRFDSDKITYTPDTKLKEQKKKHLQLLMLHYLFLIVFLI